MRKIYSYRTHRLYESVNKLEGPFYIKVVTECGEDKSCCYIEDGYEDDDFDDECENDGTPAEFEDFDEAYSSALDLANDKAEEIDGDVEENNEEGIITVTSDECTYTYTIVDNVDECDDETCDGCDDENDIELDIDDDDKDIELEIEEDEDAPMDESVASRFGKYRKLYEEDKEETDEEKDDAEDSDDSSKEGEDTDEEKDDAEDSDDSSKEGEDTDEEKDGDDEGDEDAELKAIKLTVAKDDADKCKEELIDAGIPEGDIEVIEGDDDNSVVRVDVNSVMELKDYLDGKGINLEDEIGAELVQDDEEGGDDKEGDDKDGGDDKEGDDKDGEKKDDEGGDDDFDFDSMDFFKDE